MRGSFRDKIIWTAGFLDGEGCFRAIKSYRKAGKKHGNSHVIMVSQKTRDQLDFLKSLFGGSIYHNKNRDIFQWTRGGPDARGLMMMVYPFMSQRRKEQIKTALSAPQQWCAARARSSSN